MNIYFSSFADESWNPHSLCVAVYYLPSGFVPTINPHGNSKSEKPFFPTLPSTVKSIKQSCGISGPKETIATLSSSAGGILEATYPGGLPRNELQISNFKLRVSTQVSDIPKSSGIRDEANELYSVMMKAHLEDKDVKFCRDIKAYPDLAIVVAAERQLSDITRFAVTHLSIAYSQLTLHSLLATLMLYLLPIAIFRSSVSGVVSLLSSLGLRSSTTRKTSKPIFSLLLQSLDCRERLCVRYK